MTPRDRILVALDHPDADAAVELARRLAGEVGGFKIGLELFVSHGPPIVENIRDGGMPVFLDLKLHDIPNTVAGAAAAAGRMGVSFLTVHALGGQEMIRRAVEASAEAAERERLSPPTVLAVTVLTSHDDDSLGRLGIAGPCSEAVVRLAALARAAGAPGMVCSPLEVGAVRRTVPGAVLVVPGIRPAGAALDDQARVASPASAVAAGADLLVVGRPITRADDPTAAARAIAREIGEGS